MAGYKGFFCSGAAGRKTESHIERPYLTGGKTGQLNISPSGDRSILTKSSEWGDLPHAFSSFKIRKSFKKFIYGVHHGNVRRERLDSHRIHHDTRDGIRSHRDKRHADRHRPGSRSRRSRIHHNIDRLDHNSCCRRRHQEGRHDEPRSHDNRNDGNRRNDGGSRHDSRNHHGSHRDNHHGNRRDQTELVLLAPRQCRSSE